MPVRRFVASVLGERIRGRHVWVHGVSETITDDQVWEAEETADSMYCNVVGLIDWKRILIESSIIHLESQHEDDVISGTCGKCINTALLATDRYFSWGNSGLPDTPGPEIDDWAASVAKCVGFRR